jgi:hypothetical protein
MNNIFIIIKTTRHTNKRPTKYKQNASSKILTIAYFIFYISYNIFIAISALSLFRHPSCYCIKIILVVSVSSLIYYIDYLNLLSIIFVWWRFIFLLSMTLLTSITLLMFVRLLHHHWLLLRHHGLLLHHHLRLLHHYYWLFIY